MQARLIRRADKLEQIAPAWWALWRKCPNSTPFQSPGWLLPWWQIFAPGKLLSIAVIGDDRLLALATLYIEADTTRLLPLGAGISDYVDVLIDPALQAHAGDALLRALSAHADWSNIELDELMPGASALALCACAGARMRDEPSSACPVLELTAASDGLGPRLPERKREHLALARNRAMRRGRVEFISMDEVAPEALFAALVELHRARWQSRNKPGVLSDPRVLAFHRAALPALSAQGLVRLYGLRIADTLAAVYYGFAHQDRAYDYLTGFDPAFSFESPGTLLLGHVITESWRAGAREFHFLRGAEKYKYTWGAVDRFNRRRIFERAPAPVTA
jgi:CelD/BcsL family acetyltransferase involved in cellulose biosynthesis